MEIIRTKLAKRSEAWDEIQASPESLENERVADEDCYARRAAGEYDDYTPSDEEVLAEAKAEAEKAFAAVLERENEARKKAQAPLLARADNAKQMLLFAPLFHDGRNRTFATADTLNRYVLTKRRNLFGKKEKLVKRFPAQKGSSTIYAAIIEDGDKVLFPGAFEQLIELILRKMTIEKNAEMGLWHEKRRPENNHVSVIFSLSELRKRLDENGSGRPLAEIREALEVLSNCRWVVDAPLSLQYVGELRDPILRISKVLKAKRGDAKGEKTVYEAFWHPLIAESILAADHFLLDAGITRLTDPLARWVLNRMNARYRQASKDDGYAKRGYTLSLDTILTESGIEPERRLRGTIERVRKALNELQAHDYLNNLGDHYAEKPTYETTSGRPKIVNMTWVLFPSREFAQTVIEGNREARLRSVEHEVTGES